jgi:pSer/pThr/pTyr-binding forkhead associated (FHA) protein
VRQKDDSLEGTVVDPELHAPRLKSGIVAADTRIYFRVLAGPETGKVFDVSSGGSFLVGRAKADLILCDPKVSERHAEIKIFGPEHYYLVDLASTNGTFLNGVRIDRRKFHHEDEIRVGDSLLKVSILDGTVPVSEP